jgi:hypothetical protein
MSINNHWRNKQLQDRVLWQEIQCLNFCKLHKNIKWKCHWIKGHFFDLCQDILEFDQNNTGLIIINTPTGVTVNEFVSQIRLMLNEKIKVAYLAINRYEFVADYTGNINFPDSIDDSIDLIVAQCHLDFRRLYRPESVDGKHFVGVHGLDVYVYENY